MQPTAIDLETREAFGILLERHRGILFKVANSWTRLPEDRADLIQDIAMQLWRAWPQYDPARSFSTWMYRIALNVAISFGRGDGRRRQHLVPLDDEHDIADHNATDHEAEQQVELLQSGVINGDLKAGSLTVAAGSRIRGHVECGWSDKDGKSASKTESGSAA